MTHAAGESAVFRAPPEGTHAVVLACPVPELVRLHGILDREGVQHSVVVEDDAPYSGQIMALGIAPLTPGVQRWLRHLPLLGKERPT